MTQDEHAKRFVERLLHKTHLQYQRQSMARDAAAVAAQLPSAEVRGLRRKRGISEQPKPFKLEWFTGLRPNFYKAYFETLLYMADAKR